MQNVSLAAGSRRLLAHRAYDSLKDSLQKGTFAAGSLLSERVLERRLGMSKTPIKAALVRLEEEGFVTISPQQGIFVRETSVRAVSDLFDLREALETWVVRRLARTITPAQLERLDRNLRAQEKAVKEDDLEATTVLDAEFHTLICSFADNLEIERIMVRLRDQLHRLILKVLHTNHERLRPGYLEHRGIAAAIRRHDGELAARRVVDHLRYGRDILTRR